MHDPMDGHSCYGTPHQISQLTRVEWTVMWEDALRMLRDHPVVETRRYIIQLFHLSKFPWHALVIHEPLRVLTKNDPWIMEILLSNECGTDVDFDRIVWLTAATKTPLCPWGDAKFFSALLTRCSQNTFARRWPSKNGGANTFLGLVWHRNYTPHIQAVFAFCKDTLGERIDLLEKFHPAGNAIDCWMSYCIQNVPERASEFFHAYLQWVATIRIIQRLRSERRNEQEKVLASRFLNISLILQLVTRYESWIPTYDDPKVLENAIAPYLAIIRKIGNKVS